MSPPFNNTPSAPLGADGAAHANKGAEPPYPGEMVILKRDLEPTQAHLLGDFLRRCGIAAETGDADLVRIQPLLTIALGGAKIRVPQSQVTEALELLAAFERGEFALDENSETASHSAEPSQD